MTFVSNVLLSRQILSRAGGLSRSSIFINRNRFCNFFRSSTTNAAAPETKSSEGNENVPNQTTPENEELKKLTEQNAKLVEEITDFKDRYRRALAEAENTRVRFTKMVNDTKIFGIQSFCKDLLEVADILNLAIVNTPKQSSDDLGTLKRDFVNLHQGLLMTEERMQKIFLKNGLVQIKPNEGDKFDPNFHDALFQAKIPEKQSGTIIQVMKTGYRLQDRVIRAAQVGVAQ